MKFATSSEVLSSEKFHQSSHYIDYFLSKKGLHKRIDFILAKPEFQKNLFEFRKINSLIRLLRNLVEDLLNTPPLLKLS